MTLQVGLVGRDGIVLASDRLLQSYEGSSRSVSRTSKFLGGAGAICCWSGDSIAEQSAYGIRNHDWTIAVSNEIEPSRSTLMEIGNAACRKVEAQFGTVPGAARKVLTVLHRDQLWLLDISVQNGAVARPILDREVAGDTANTCRYFMNRYANWCNLRPIAELVPLAAYTILAAGEENPYGVGGLEVVVVPKGEVPLFLSGERERELESWFRETAKLIQRKLSDPFNYGPVAPPQS